MKAQTWHLMSGWFFPIASTGTAQHWRGLMGKDLTGRCGQLSWALPSRMAVPSPWRWPFNCGIANSIHCPKVFPIYYSKRRRVIPWSSNFNSSSSLCGWAVNNCSSNARKRVRRKSVETITIDSDPQNNEVFDSSVNGGVFNGRRLSFKSVFGKRTLWRRILFASRKVRSIILLNVIAIIYASNIPVVKEVEAIIDPEAFTIVRFAVAAIPFIPLVFPARDDAHTRNAGVELGIWVSLGYILQALGLLTSDAGRASFPSMFTVIVVPLIDGLLGSMIPARTWFAALMYIIGVAMLESSGSPPCICIVALLSAVWYFIEGWSAGSIQEPNPFSWTWGAALDWITSFPWIPAFYTGIFSTGLCLWVEMSAMCDVSATETAIIYALEPVWGAGFAWFLLGERWGISGWIGAALVLGGSLTVQIMGATSDSVSREQKIGDAESNESFVSDKKNGFSTSPIVNSRKDPSDLIKK